MTKFFEAASKWSDVGLWHKEIGYWESASGPGSTLDVASKSIELIESTISDNNIRSILDLGCGDWNWMQKLKPVFDDVTYEGWDAGQTIIDLNNENHSDKNITFHRKDIITDEYPQVDLIVCRDVLFHLPIEDGLEVIEKIRASGAKYLISTSYNDVKENIILTKSLDNVNGFCFYMINLLIEPFNLDDSLTLSIEETVKCKESNRHICLFKL